MTTRINKPHDNNKSELVITLLMTSSRSNTESNDNAIDASKFITDNLDGLINSFLKYQNSLNLS